MKMRHDLAPKSFFPFPNNSSFGAICQAGLHMPNNRIELTATEPHFCEHVSNVPRVGTKDNKDVALDTVVRAHCGAYDCRADERIPSDSANFFFCPIYIR